VTDGPIAYARAFFSKTNVDKFCDACARFGALFPAPSAGVCDPSVAAAEAPVKGVVAPELACVARTEASLREFSDMICFRFLLRR